MSILDYVYILIAFLLFFFNFQEKDLAGSVKHQINLVWPYWPSAVRQRILRRDTDWLVIFTTSFQVWLVRKFGRDSSPRSSQSCKGVFHCEPGQWR